MRVLLVDDHQLMLDSLASLLTTNGFRVVGMARDGFTALELARSLKPDLILMDISMPVCDGLMATRLIKAELADIRIVMLTASEEDENLFEAIKSGAMGYLLKNLRSQEIITRLKLLEQDEPPLSPGFAVKIMKELARQASPQPAQPESEEGEMVLTGRQKQVLSLIAQGLTYAQAAEQLHLSEATVRYHFTKIIEGLHLENRTQVISYAARLGYGRHQSS